jgi:hypothetical protein
LPGVGVSAGFGGAGVADGCGVTLADGCGVDVAPGCGVALAPGRGVLVLPGRGVAVAEPGVGVRPDTRVPVASGCAELPALGEAKSD